LGLIPAIPEREKYLINDHIYIAIIYTKWPYNIQNGHMYVNYTNIIHF
jgi:hypothetical protein